MNVTYIHSCQQADQHRVQTRCRNLAVAIGRTGWHSANLLGLEDFVNNTPTAYEACANSDLLVIHRYLYGPVIRALQSWKARDKKVVVDIDEALDRLPPETAGYRFWQQGVPFESCGTNSDCSVISPLPIEQLRLGLRLADGVTVASVRLADDWSEAAHVTHVPDYINLDQYLTIKQGHGKETWVGLNGEGMGAGCLTRIGLKTALEKLCAQRDAVRLMLVGFDAADTADLKISPHQKMILPASPVEQWPRLLAQFDLGIALADREHGSRGGWQRALEFMVMKIPWIGSDLPLHRDLARFGWMVKNTPAAWERALLEVVDHLDVYRSEATGESFLYALGQDVNENISKVLAAYATILYQS